MDILMVVEPRLTAQQEDDIAIGCISINGYQNIFN